MYQIRIWGKLQPYYIGFGGSFLFVTTSLSYNYVLYGLIHLKLLLSIVRGIQLSPQHILEYFHQKEILSSLMCTIQFP